MVKTLHRRKIYAHGNVKTLMTFFSENARRPTSTHLTVEKDQVRFNLTAAGCINPHTR